MANGLPRESIGHYTGLGQRILVELNPNILVRDAIRMAWLIKLYNTPPSILTLGPHPPWLGYREYRENDKKK